MPRSSTTAKAKRWCRRRQVRWTKGSDAKAGDAKAKKAKKANGGNVAAAKTIGKLVAERAQEKGIKSVVFDRGGFQYHGRIKALADAAREAGLEF